jgi:hypothetical protein
MEPTSWRLAAILFALTVSAFLTGGGLYEQAVLDTAWPRKPSIVRPAEGGANRKFFWVPANIVAAVALLLAVWSAWPVAAARYAALAALGLFAVINAVTISYFAPRVLRVEKESVPPDDLSSYCWTRLSRLRSPLSLGMNAALAVAAAHLMVP